MEFLRHLGITYADFVDPKVDFPRVHVECDYISPLGFDDLLDTGVSVEHIGRSSFTLGFVMNVAGRLAARAKLVIVAINPLTYKSIPIPDALRAALNSRNL